MNAQFSQNFNFINENHIIQSNNPLWKKYKANCKDQEKLIEEKYKFYSSEMRKHHSYTQELSYFINNGYDLTFFPNYFLSKLEYLKFMEIINMRQKLFKTECLRYRGYDISDTENLMATSFFDDGSTNTICVINSILNSSAKEYIPQNISEQLEETLARAIDYDSLNIKFNLNAKDELLFVNIRKILRNQLLSEFLSMYEKAFIRKIVNDIQQLIKLEFATSKCMEDHDSLGRNISNISEENNSQLNKIKLVRNNVIFEDAIEQENAISENLVVINEQE